MICFSLCSSICVTSVYWIVNLITFNKFFLANGIPFCCKKYWNVMFPPSFSCPPQALLGSPSPSLAPFSTTYCGLRSPELSAPICTHAWTAFPGADLCIACFFLSGTVSLHLFLMPSFVPRVFVTHGTLQLASTFLFTFVLLGRPQSLRAEFITYFHLCVFCATILNETRNGDNVAS